MKETRFYTIANNAVFCATMDNKSRDFLQAFDCLFLTLAAKEKYTEVDKDLIIKDFFEMYGLEINGMFVSEFIGRLTNQKFLIRQTNTNKKLFDREKIDSLNLLESLQHINDETALFVKKFVNFIEEKGILFLEEKAQDIVVSSIEENVCGISTVANECDVHNSPQDRYLFSKFLEHIQEHDKSQFVTYQKITLGRIFASVIADNRITEENSNFAFKNLKIYLDTSFVFNALDMDVYGTSKEYLDMIEALKANGARLYVFKHVYNEIWDLVENSIKWIDNPEFDETIASRTAVYFVKTRKTKVEANSILYSLERQINNLGIQIQETNIDYNSCEFDAVHEEEIYQKIIQTYKNSSSPFDSTKEEAYRNDARSLYAVYRLREKRSVRKFKDAEHVFITNNYSLCLIANEYQQKIFQGAGIPFAINSKLLNVLLWFSSKKYSNESNSMFLIPAAYHSFQPSMQLLKKLDVFLKDMRNKKLLTDGEVLDWKSDRTLTKEILEETQNNPENFNEDTTFHIIEKLKNRYAQSLDAFGDLKVQKILLEKDINRVTKKVTTYLLIFIIFFLVGLGIGFYFIFSALIAIPNISETGNAFLNAGLALLVSAVPSLIALIFKSKEKTSLFKLMTAKFSAILNRKKESRLTVINEQLENIKKQ